MDNPPIESRIALEPVSSQTPEAPAEGGDADAQFDRGFKFANDGARQDYAQAARWYLKAAEQNHALAQLNLSVMYAKGQGMQRDEARAMMWLARSANLGDAGAQYTLGMKQNRLSLGQEPATGEETRIEAYKWLQLSAAQGYLNSQAGCDFVTMGMTRAGVIEGNRRAATFVPGPGVQ